MSYYTHEYQDGPNSTILLAAGTGQGGNFSDLGFGSFVVFDNLMKDGVSSDSKLLGKVTGFSVVTTIAKYGEFGYSSQFNGQHIFYDGEYNGSAFTVIPGGIILGGSGYFQGYTGYGETVDDFAAESGLYHVYKWDIYLSN